MAEEGKKRGKKGMFAALLAALAGLAFFAKKRRSGAGEESGWEEARPEAP